MKKSARYYSENPKARAKKNAYQSVFNAQPEQKRRRAELNRYNRLAKTYGNRDGLDASHSGDKITGFKKASANRGSKKNSAGDRRARG
jgi:hypothetical protein